MDAHLRLLPPHPRPCAVYSAAPGGVPYYECLVNHPGCAVAVLVDSPNVGMNVAMLVALVAYHSPDAVVRRGQAVKVLILASRARAARAQAVSHSPAFDGIG